MAGESEEIYHWKEPGKVWGKAEESQLWMRKKVAANQIDLFNWVLLDTYNYNIVNKMFQLGEYQNSW